MRTRVVSIVAALAAGAAFAAAAHAQLSPDRLYYGVNRPVPMSVEVPEGAQGEVEIHLLRPVDAEIVEKASAEAGRVDLSTLFPILWTRQTPTLLYAQLVVGGEKIGPGVVLQPLLTPRRATASGRSVTFSPDMGRISSGLRAYTDRHIVFETSEGDITVALRPDQAPNTCMNMIHLVEGGYYTNIIAHRILPSFVVQFGDPTGSGGGGPGYNFDLEPSQLLHEFGVISMARTSDPDTNGSQVFLCLDRSSTQALDGAYTAFGYMVGGADTLVRLASTPLADPRAGAPAEPPVIKSARTIPAPPHGQGPERVTRPAQAPAQR